jgi:peptidyl-tRNA hydrolase, PTH2 family
LYAIIREDLEMPPGKLSSQSGHAFLNAYIDSLAKRPDIAAHYQRDGIGTKVCLKAKNQDKLMQAYLACIDAGIPCSLIIDQHHIMPPHFTGEPIITALGIGPARKAEINHITKRFSLCK